MFPRVLQMDRDGLEGDVCTYHITIELAGTNEYNC